MLEIPPIDPARSLPAVERVNRDRPGRRQEPPPEPKDEEPPPEDPDAPPHIDEYA